jgi:hypothetical protein
MLFPVENQLGRVVELTRAVPRHMDGGKPDMAFNAGTQRTRRKTLAA